MSFWTYILPLLLIISKPGSAYADNTICTLEQEDKFLDDEFALNKPPDSVALDCFDDLADGGYNLEKFYPESEQEFQMMCATQSCKPFVAGVTLYYEEVTLLLPDCDSEIIQMGLLASSEFSDIMTTCEWKENDGSASADNSICMLKYKDDFAALDKPLNDVQENCEKDLATAGGSFPPQSDEDMQIFCGFDSCNNYSSEYYYYYEEAKRLAPDCDGVPQQEHEDNFNEIYKIMTNCVSLNNDNAAGSVSADVVSIHLWCMIVVAVLVNINP